MTEIHTSVGVLKDNLPYFVALIRFDDKKKVLGQMVGESTKPKIGDKVIGVLRRLQKPAKKDVVEYGVKFKII